MSRPSGRPPGEHRTRLIRVREDLAEMLAWVADLSGDTIADITGSILRPEVERRYDIIESRVKIIKAAKAGPVMVPDLGGES